MEETIVRCFLRWGGIKVIGKARHSREYILSKNKQFFSVSPEDLWQWSHAIAFLEEMPEIPAVLDKYGRHHAIDSLFRGVRFGTYLASVSLWGNMMKSGKQDSESIASLISLLYGFRPKHIRPEFVGCVIYWMSSIQEYFAKRFKDLFSPQKSSDGQGSLASSSGSFKDSSNAMIRALTKGDVLKEKQVLDIDTWRALTELDALAMETKRINDSIKRK